MILACSKQDEWQPNWLCANNLHWEPEKKGFAFKLTNWYCLDAISIHYINFQMESKWMVRFFCYAYMCEKGFG